MQIPARTPSLSVLLVSCLAASFARAQGGEGSRWNTIPLPAGGRTIASVGTMVTVRTPTRVLFYSGILKRWTALTVSPTATLRTWNAFATVEDGLVVHAYASRRGTIETITTTAARRLVNGPATANWVTVVTDGNKVWGFSPFTGKWALVTVGSTAPRVVAGHLCAVVHDGARAHGFSVHHGTWVGTAAPGAAVTIAASGSVGLANSPNAFRGFASQKNVWATRSVQVTATNLSLQRGYAQVVNGKTVTAFSAYRGNFASYTAAGTLQSHPGREMAVYVDGNRAVGYAATDGAFRTLVATGPTVALNSELAVITSVADKKIWGFSGVTGKFSAPLSGSFTVTTNESVAFAKGTPLSYAFSPILGSWVRSSKVLFSGTTLLRNAVLLKHGSGYSAFSSRYARWSELPASASAVVHLPRRGRGSTLVVQDGASLHAFDSRLGRWASARTGANPNFAIFRVIALAEDGKTGYGFGLFNNAWDTVQLSGQVLTLRASSSIGYIETKTHLHVFSAHGSLSTISRFPEFSRFQLRGTRLRLIQAAPASSFVVSLVGLAPGAVPTTLGTLFLDPKASILAFPAPVVPSDGRLDFSAGVPDDPRLSGQAIHVQNLILPPSGRPYLTNSIAPVIL